MFYIVSSIIFYTLPSNWRENFGRLDYSPSRTPGLPAIRWHHWLIPDWKFPRLPSMIPSSRPSDQSWRPLGPFHQLEQRLPHIQPLLLSAFDQVLWMFLHLVKKKMHFFSFSFFTLFGFCRLSRQAGVNVSYQQCPEYKVERFWIIIKMFCVHRQDCRSITRCPSTSPIFGPQPKQKSCWGRRWRLVLTSVQSAQSGLSISRRLSKKSIFFVVI